MTRYSELAIGQPFGPPENSTLAAQLTIHWTPKRSTHMPNFSAHSVFCIGIWTLPPAESQRHGERPAGAALDERGRVPGSLPGGP